MSDDKLFVGVPVYREMCLWIEPFGSLSVVFYEAVLAMKALPRLIASLVATELGVAPRTGLELVHQP
jgi:hypothetical protein